MSRFCFGRAAVCALFAFSAMAPAADAAIDTGSAIIISRNTAAASDPHLYQPNSKTQYGTPGGEFWVREILSPQTTLATAPSGTDFSGDSLKTFCLEVTEHIVLGGKYWVTIDDIALAGGGAIAWNYDAVPGGGNDSYNPSLAVAGGDPLSDATRWLYKTYRDGKLDDETGDAYLYSTSGAVDGSDAAKALQQAIWDLEGESTLSPMTALATSLKTTAQNKATSANNGVRVMNIWTTRHFISTGVYAYSGLAQSQLFMDSTQGGHGDVPEPASIFIWTVVGALGLVAGRRRFR